MNRRLRTTSGFDRALKRLRKSHPEVRPKLLETFVRLELNPFDPRLGTHKLSGAYAGLWSCSVAYDLRIIFEVTTEDGVETIVLLNLGTHDEVC